MIRFTHVFQTSQLFSCLCAFQGVEVFSYLGGLLSMWLGFSFLRSYYYFERITKHIYEYVEARKRKRKVSTYGTLLYAASRFRGAGLRRRNERKMRLSQVAQGRLEPLKPVASERKANYNSPEMRCRLNAK